MPGSICSVSSCKNASRKSATEVFHCFPKDPVIHDAWVSKLNLGKNVKTKSRRVCSKHFRPEDYKRLQTGYLGSKILRSDAVPSLHLFEDSAGNDNVNKVLSPKPNEDKVGVNMKIVKIEHIDDNSFKNMPTILTKPTSSTTPPVVSTAVQPESRMVVIKKGNSPVKINSPFITGVSVLKQLNDLKEENAKLQQRIQELEKHSTQLNGILAELIQNKSATQEQASANTDVKNIPNLVSGMLTKNQVKVIILKKRKRSHEKGK